MEMKKLNNVGPGDAMRKDLYHMGFRVGTNVMVLFPNHDNKQCKYLVVCDEETGERLQISFTNDAINFNTL